jgi:hypothetical protein
MRRPAPDPHPDQDLLQESEPVAEWLLNRHVSLATEWLPHQYGHGGLVKLRHRAWIRNSRG